MKYKIFQIAVVIIYFMTSLACKREKRNPVNLNVNSKTIKYTKPTIAIDISPKSVQKYNLKELINFKIGNNTQNIILTSESYDVEYEYENKSTLESNHWVRLNHDTFFDDVLLKIHPKSNKVFEIRLENIEGELLTGNYRISKKVNIQKKDTIVYGYFSIK